MSTYNIQPETFVSGSQNEVLKEMVLHYQQKQIQDTLNLKIGIGVFVALIIVVAFTVFIKRSNRINGLK